MKKNKSIIILVCILVISIIANITVYALVGNTPLQSNDIPIIQDDVVVNDQVKIKLPNGEEKQLKLSEQQIKGDKVDVFNYIDEKEPMRQHKINDKGEYLGFLDMSAVKQNPDISLGEKEVVGLAGKFMKEYFKDKFDGFTYSYNTYQKSGDLYYVYFHKFYGKDDCILGEKGYVYIYTDGTIMSCGLDPEGKYAGVGRSKLNTVAKADIESFVKDQVDAIYENYLSYEISEIKLMNVNDKPTVVAVTEVCYGEMVAGVPFERIEIFYYEMS